MTRQQTIKTMMEKAIEMQRTGYHWDKAKEIWDMAYDWNAEHYGNEEIFMSELYKEDGYDGDGFAIEDDMFFFED